jgi:RNA polymerase sigma-70 factor (ECF subfamily)
VCQSILLNEHDADEAVQDAFLKAHRYLQSFRFESRFSTWLSQIARREALTRLAARKRAKNLMTEVLGDPSLVTAWQPKPIRARGEGFSREVLALLDQLDPEDRLVLVMHELEGFEYADIAEVLESAPGAVRMRALRARKKLRVLFEKT